jgi:hypothetical protein
MSCDCAGTIANEQSTYTAILGNSANKQNHNVHILVNEEGCTL